MSNMEPFDERSSELEPLVPSDTTPFKAPMENFDKAAYIARQIQLDEVLQGGDVAAVLTELHAENPDLGITVNNVHNTEIVGPVPRGLNAALAVFTKTAVEADIPGLNFDGGVAPEADFAAVDLRGANFNDSILPATSFRGAILRGANFNNAVVNGADFTGADLRGVDFSGAYMVGVKGIEDPEIIKQINLSAARTVIADKIADGSLEQFLATHFGNIEDLERIKRFLDGVPVSIDQIAPILQTQHNFRGLVAHNLRANDVEFGESILTGASFEGLVANRVQFRNAHLGGTVIRGAFMRDADFMAAWAPGLILEDVDLSGAQFTNANLVGSIFRGVNLRGVVGLDATDTNLEGVVIEDSILPQGYGYNGIAIERSQKLARELEA